MCIGTPCTIQLEFPKYCQKLKKEVLKYIIGRRHVFIFLIQEQLKYVIFKPGTKSENILEQELDLTPALRTIPFTIITFFQNKFYVNY